jgi:hypothetical protein
MEQKRPPPSSSWNRRVSLDTPVSGFSTAIPKLTVWKMRGVPRRGVGRYSDTSAAPATAPETQSGIPEICRRFQVRTATARQGIPQAVEDALNFQAISAFAEIHPPLTHRPDVLPRHLHRLKTKLI